jgi:Pretoxin HINT domain
MSCDTVQESNIATLERPTTTSPSTKAVIPPFRFSWRFAGRVVLLSSLLAAAFCVWKGQQAANTSTRAIETIRVGERVIVDASQEALVADVARLSGVAVDWDHGGDLAVAGVEDPFRELIDVSIQQIDRAEYRLVKIRAQEVWADGTIDRINVETLQPTHWLQAHDVHVGGQAPLPLDVEEMGMAPGLTGKVVDVLPCPRIRPGPGRVVLTTINHLNPDVIELTLEDESSNRETLRPTGTHKFYSVSQDKWLSASELKSGEQLDGINGQVTVVASRNIPGTHRVYNFTVQGEHLYRVANCGVLVHNNGCSVSAGDDYVDIYRGVNSEHIRYGDAIDGVAVPGSVKGHANAYLHGMEGSRTSRFTSWTTNENVAIHFAKSAEDIANRGVGVVLHKRVLRSELMRGQGIFAREEAEVLLKGVVENAGVKWILPN